MIKLRYKTQPGWAKHIVENMDVFLPDHAAAEKKASSMAMTMVAHYPDKPVLVMAMIDLALEELTHFKAVVKLMRARNLVLVADEKDPYVNALRQYSRRGDDVYLMDRLLIGGIVEARGAERFGLITAALPEGDLKRFYDSITRSEEAHQGLFLQLAEHYFDGADVHLRLGQLLDVEADIVRGLPLRAALH